MLRNDNKAQPPKVHYGSMQVSMKDMAMTNTQWSHTAMTNKIECSHKQYIVELHNERKHSHGPIQGASMWQ